MISVMFRNKDVGMMNIEQYCSSDVHIVYAVLYILNGRHLFKRKTKIHLFVSNIFVSLSIHTYFER